MPVSLQCPNTACAKVSLAPDAFVGRSVRCKVCGRSFVVGPTLDGGPATTRPAGAGDDPFPTLPAEFGRYRVVRLLGRGGMGAVYLADDTALQRQVALKLPTFAAAESPLRVERFMREARAAAGLAHPNICTVFDVGRQDGRPYITMAFIEGKPLDADIDPDRPMPERRAAGLARAVALALQAAHDKGIVHRDLKPANVMLTPAGEPVVMDFGLAKRLADAESDAVEAKLTRDGAVLGTPSYMAPEQVRGEVGRIGPATDVYSLGVLLFELLTGRVPYQGPLGVVMGQILAAPVPAVTEFRPDADPRLDAVCRRAMAKEAGERFPSMAALAAALDDYLRGSDPTATASWSAIVSAPPPTPAAAASAPLRPRRRWPLVVGAAALTWSVVAGVLLTDRTTHGDVVIELSDPAAKVDVAVDGERIDAAAAGKTFRLRAGGHGLTAAGDGYETETVKFAVKHGGREVVRVTLRPKAGATVAPPRVPPTPPAGAGPPPTPLPDARRIRELAAGPPAASRDFTRPDHAPESRPNAEFVDGYFRMTEAARNILHATRPVATTPAAFVVRVTARQTTTSTGEWWLEFERPGVQAVQIKCGHASPFIQCYDGTPPNQTKTEWRFPAVRPKPVGEWNEVTVAADDKRLRLFLNGAAAGDAIELPEPLGPAEVKLFVWHGGGGGRTAVEFESLSVWPLPVAASPSEP